MNKLTCIASAHCTCIGEATLHKQAHRTSECMTLARFALSFGGKAVICVICQAKHLDNKIWVVQKVCLSSMVPATFSMQAPSSRWENGNTTPCIAIATVLNHRMGWAWPPQIYKLSQSMASVLQQHCFQSNTYNVSVFKVGEHQYIANNLDNWMLKANQAQSNSTPCIL